MAGGVPYGEIKIIVALLEVDQFIDSDAAIRVFAQGFLI